MSRENAKKDRAAKRKITLANSEKYDKEYKTAELTLIDTKRKAKAAGNFFVEPMPKVAFAIRTRG